MHSSSPLVKYLLFTIFISLLLLSLSLLSLADDEMAAARKTSTDIATTTTAISRASPSPSSFFNENCISYNPSERMISISIQPKDKEFKHG